MARPPSSPEADAEAASRAYVQSMPDHVPSGRPLATSRRDFLRQVLAAGPVAAVGCRPATPEAPEAPEDAAAAACAPTSENILGPFFREGAPVRAELNVAGEAGTPLRVSGRVLADDCRTPVAGAWIDLWQAGPDGRYDNDSPDYRFRGRVPTSDDGSYSFTTLLPGRYLNGATYRPRHVHYKVQATGLKELVTQLYFEGDPYLETDPYDLPDLIVALAQDGEGGLVAAFDIVLAGVS